MLDYFDLGTTVDNDRFMTTISKSTNTALISKQEFHAEIYNFVFTQFFTLHSFIYSWAYLVRSQCSKCYSTKIAKKNFNGTDRGEMLIFQQFILFWLFYELVKDLYVFGLQSQIRSDISDWSQELHTAFNNFNNKQHKHNKMALKVLDTLFDKTKHNSYFNKII